MPWLEAGMEFPPKDDRPRLDRYAEFRHWFDGDHFNAKEAKRIAEKLGEAKGGEAVVYLVMNLPRLHAEKFADLQILRTPKIRTVDGDAEEAKAALLDDNPNLWGELHYVAQMRRALGDGCFVTTRPVEGKALLRDVDPASWFPVCDPDDPRVFTGHQVATVRKLEDERGQEVNHLRVECYEPGGKCTIKTFLLSSGNKAAEMRSNYAVYQIKSLLEEEVQEAVNAPDGFLFHHVPNGKLRPGSPFGRSDYADKGALFDELNWRLAAWASANDEASHPYLIQPERYLGQDEHGQVLEPGKWVRKRYTGTTRGDPSEVPSYASFTFAPESSERQFWATLKTTLMVLQLAPALLGVEFAAAKESGEAKSLGMATSEAAARRDLLYTAPVVDDALTAMLTLKGQPAEVTVEWRIGIPKTEQDQIDEVIALRNAGLLSLRDALVKLHSNATDKEVDAMVEAIQAEDIMRDPLQSFTG